MDYSAAVLFGNDFTARIAGCSESTIKRRLKGWNIAWLCHPKTGHWVFIKDIQ